MIRIDTKRTLIVSVILILLFNTVSCTKENEPKNDDSDTVEPSAIEPTAPEEKTDSIGIEVSDEGEIIFYSYEDYYRYGPSIMEYEDGSMDAWFSAPGNSGSQWDWITYRHSDDGVNWGDEQVVLRPTPGSKDQCSVCDPTVIYFDGYYYLGYSATWDYDSAGMNNSAFVARSLYPDGPYEKWNGYGWGGDPEPIIEYKGDPAGWGIGELSFVIYDEDLCLFYTYIDTKQNSIRLHKADLVEDWPSTLRYKLRVLSRDQIDSLDVVYDDDMKTFLSFSIKDRMTADSSLVMFQSYNGKDFVEVASTKEYIEDYAHNLGVAKDPQGHISSSREILIGYAYGEEWGRWNLKVQKIAIR